VAALRFYFGTMGSGKSTLALQIHHNLTSRGLNGLVCTMLDREGAQVTSRLGVAAAAVNLDLTSDLYGLANTLAQRHGLAFVVCDEAQFYTPTQVDQLARLVDELGIDVYAFGLITDFRGLLFDGTKRLLEVADERVALQVEARCWARATHNARLVNAILVRDGDVVSVGDVVVAGDTSAGEAPLFGDVVSYELLCRRHYLAGLTGREAPDAPRRAAGLRGALRDVETHGALQRQAPRLP
jgi:thymidine kinase